jgi:hypothetical protein
MSALGQKRTYAVQIECPLRANRDARKGYETFRRSALADIPQCNGDVRFGSQADISTATSHVRFTPESRDSIPK